MFPTLRFECTCFDPGWFFAGRGAFNGRPAFKFVDATDEVYELVYGRAPEKDDDEEPSQPPRTGASMAKHSV